MFYKRLKELIEQTGLSVNQIERDLGYPRNTLQNYRNGQDPSALRLKELSEYFGVTIEYLIGDIGQAKVMPLEKFFSRLNFDQKKELIKISQEWLLQSLDDEEDV